MLRIIFLIIALFVCLTIARDSKANYAALQPVTKSWELDWTTTQGAKTRVLAHQQNPYSFCFSTAAAALWDQQRCLLANRGCKTFPRSSFLAATPAGQDLPVGVAIEINRAGSTVRSLRHLSETGFVGFDRCNYNHAKETDADYTLKLTTQGEITKLIVQAKERWDEHQKYAPYLERFWRRAFRETVRVANPQLGIEIVDRILAQPLTEPELMSKILVGPGCYTDLKRDRRFRVQYQAINSKSRATAALIEELLAQNKPVIVNICLSGSVADCTEINRHSLVVVAQAKAKHSATGDLRTVYWVVNSWGELWQQANADGWVFADHFLDGVLGEVVWLDQK